jgi:hypothetical protein
LTVVGRWQKRSDPGDVQRQTPNRLKANDERPATNDRHMKIVTAAEMRAIDRATSERFGVPSLTLMENAGTAVAEHVVDFYNDARKIVVFCG